MLWNASFNWAGLNPWLYSWKLKALLSCYLFQVNQLQLMKMRKFLQFFFATVCLQQLKFSNALEVIEILKSDYSPVVYGDDFIDIILNYYHLFSSGCLLLAAVIPSCTSWAHPLGFCLECFLLRLTLNWKNRFSVCVMFLFLFYG